MNWKSNQIKQELLEELSNSPFSKEEQMYIKRMFEAVFNIIDREIEVNKPSIDL